MAYDDDELDELAAEDRWQRRRRLQKRRHWHSQDPDYVYEDHEHLPEDDESVPSDPLDTGEVRDGT